MITLLFLVGFLSVESNLMAGSNNFQAIPWQEGLSPMDIFGEGTPLFILEGGQVTEDGKIIFCTRNGLLVYDTDGNFLFQIECESDLEIKSQYFDVATGLFMVNYSRYSDPDAGSYLRFYYEDGSPYTIPTEDGSAVPYELMFELDGQRMVIEQMTAIEQNLFLFTAWSKVLVEKNEPENLVFLTRSFENGKIVFKKAGEFFDRQTSKKRQFDNNFSSRWAALQKTKAGEFLVVAHEMTESLTTSSFDSASAFSMPDQVFLKEEPAFGSELSLPFWEPTRWYDYDIRKRLEGRTKTEPSPMEVTRAWFYHFSRISGMYALSDQEMVLGYISPNPNHPYYRDFEMYVAPKKPMAPFTLHLGTLTTKNQVKPKWSGSLGSVPGGMLLGVHQGKAYVLTEKSFPNPDGSHMRTYDLMKLDL